MSDPSDSMGNSANDASSIRRRRTEQTPRSAKRKRHSLGIGISIAAALLLLVGTTAWLGVQAGIIKDNLQSTTELLPQLKQQLAANDPTAAAATVDALAGHTEAAKGAGMDPLWKAAGALPWVGANFSAATKITVTADDVVQLAAKPLLGAYSSLDWKALTPKDGTVGLDAISTAAPKVVAAANTVQLSYDRLAEIDTSKLLPQIAAPLSQAKDQLGDLRGTLNIAASTVQLLPAMMGSDDARNYLLLIQNSAEIRATGGIPGALAVLRADHGKIELSSQDTASSLGLFDPALKVDPAQEAIYSNRMSSFMQNVNMTPDFPTAATTARTMWQQRHPGDVIDGVITVDPSALALVLKATGPVDVRSAIPEGVDVGSLPTTLNSENLVKALLSDVYAEIQEPALQDAYFAEVAKKIFAEISSGKTPGDKLVHALGTGVAENRIKIWSSHADEQKLLASQRMGGAISGPSIAPATFGVYFNDGTGAKMDYYVQRTVQLVQQCTSGGYGQYTARIKLTNTAPADAATSLPRYVTGGGVFDVTPGYVATNVIGYGPFQARIQSARVNGETSSLSSFSHAERPVGVIPVVLAPGQTTTVELNFAKVVQSSQPHLEVTPTIQSSNEVILPMEAASNCSTAIG